MTHHPRIGTDLRTHEINWKLMAPIAPELAELALIDMDFQTDFPDHPAYTLRVNIQVICYGLISSIVDEHIGKYRFTSNRVSLTVLLMDVQGSPHHALQCRAVVHPATANPMHPDEVISLKRGKRSSKYLTPLYRFRDIAIKPGWHPKLIKFAKYLARDIKSFDLV